LYNYTLGELIAILNATGNTFQVNNQIDGLSLKHANQIILIGDPYAPLYAWSPLATALHAL
jgi:hypothetical protein